VTKQISIGELFTAAELKAATKLYGECKPGEFNKRVVKQIVEPALPRINKVTGQENDARYWGYALEFALTQQRD
jgi:hypothetical protein